ncbi:AraC family transcriptional regulator [Bradyrhizobium sp. Ec3.3]|uniref:helix-turn-helix transcriptional regulator n=1 Tax=Bradyrhizobium sp. Ec3.3 TaxID=189753 RepID=UPI00042859B4|nr:AraC family transcriptional regulator [Bradyrhizobium sp. Ec3.3]
MTATKPTSSPIAISTEDIPPHQRLIQWRKIYGRSIAGVDIKLIDDEPFRASVTFQALPSTEFVTRFQSAAISGIEPSANTMHSHWSFLTIVLAGPSLPALVQVLDSPYPSQIAADNNALQLLIRYVKMLHDDGPLDDAALAQAVAKQIIDLVGLAIGTGADVAHEPRQRWDGAARLRAIKADIRNCLGDRTLSSTTIAARHGVKPRYVRKLFEGDGTSLSQFVLALRLQRALEMLKNPEFAGHEIRAIALDCGFSDISYFNRSFRRAYGTKPSDIRAAIYRAS